MTLAPKLTHSHSEVIIFPRYYLLYLPHISILGLGRISTWEGKGRCPFRPAAHHQAKISVFDARYKGGLRAVKFRQGLGSSMGKAPPHKTLPYTPAIHHLWLPHSHVFQSSLALTIHLLRDLLSPISSLIAIISYLSFSRRSKLAFSFFCISAEILLCCTADVTESK